MTPDARPPSDETPATGWHRHRSGSICQADKCHWPDLADRTTPVLVVNPAEAREKIDTLAAEAGHWAAMENARPTDLVCECGLPWTIGEGCAYVQGARALLAALATQEPPT